jgi:hypothetical protein
MASPVDISIASTSADALDAAIAVEVATATAHIADLTPDFTDMPISPKDDDLDVTSFEEPVISSAPTLAPAAASIAPAYIHKPPPHPATDIKFVPLTMKEHAAFLIRRASCLSVHLRRCVKLQELCLKTAVLAEKEWEMVAPSLNRELILLFSQK